MKKALFAGTLLVGFASAGSAFAERWVTPVNGTVSAKPMTNGTVMMKITLPAAEYQMIDRDMRANNNICVIKEADAGKTGSLILLCGVKDSLVQ